MTELVASFFCLNVSQRVATAGDTPTRRYPYVWVPHHLRFARASLRCAVTRAPSLLLRLEPDLPLLLTPRPSGLPNEPLSALRESFVLTNAIGQFYLGPMNLDEAVETVQLTYPQVYYVCHTRHQRKRSTAHRLSARDAAILAHCSAEVPIIPARLATHLSVARSTLSEALKKLDSSGYIQRVAAIHGDRRLSGVMLTPKGLQAVRETSVLESKRLESVLRLASPPELAVISKGLLKLAEVCRRYSERVPPTRNGEE